MSDEELLNAVITCSLPLSEWSHRAHVRIAYLYSLRLDWDAAIEQMRRSIKAYNRATNTPETLDRGYHETITQAFMRLVFAAARQAESCTSSEEFCDQHPELLNKLVLRQYYSPDRMMSMTAKKEFVTPDLLPLPLVGPSSKQ
jgi:hypothetical protein